MNGKTLRESPMAEEAQMNVAYLVLKTAHNLYGKDPAALAPAERSKVERLAERQFGLEDQILSSPEARDVVVPPATLDAALAEIRARYGDEGEFGRDLSGNGLTLLAFSASLERELKVEAVLEKVGSRAARVSDIDVELYYHYHPEQFRRPEVRRARHILVTINEAIPENTRTAARLRIDAIAARLFKDPKRFEEQALKHSECPTAMNGGLLGDVTPGHLFPELETVLFDMASGQTSGVVESALGFHLLRCDAVSPAGLTPLAQAKAKVREVLESRRKRLCQQAWLKGLAKTTVPS
jgi:peptidyl-prolyl cis-trans isomerase C